MSFGTDFLKRAEEMDFSICLLFNRLVTWEFIRRLFAFFSRLGNGVFWYALIAVLPFVDGLRGGIAALHMLLVGFAGLVIYKLMKRKFIRERPFVKNHSIQLGTTPLDRFSFPSGHTLHAVGFSLVAIAYYPLLASLLVPFALLIALSRMILGLHYPSDVIMGAAIGFTIAKLSLWAAATLQLPLV
jgi:undecaprenyl-diphosphatase